jgi:tetratricopeptide (TPR) repeat protein
VRTRVLSAIGAICGLLLPLAAQRTRAIDGSVAVRGPAPGPIRVTVETPSRSFYRQTITDGAGHFVVVGVPLGEVVITAEADGYRTQRETHTLEQAIGPYPLTIILRPLDPKASRPSALQAYVSKASLLVPRDARDEYDAGRREVANKRYPQARKRFEKALGKYPQFAEALHAMAMLDMSEGRNDQALERLQLAVEADEAHYESWTALAHVLNQSGKAAEASAAAQRAVTLRPDLWQAHYELGMADLQLGRDPQVLEAADKIASLAGDKQPEPFLLRAGVYLRAGDHAKAREALARFLELAPEHPHAPVARKTLGEIAKK